MTLRSSTTGAKFEHGSTDRVVPRPDLPPVLAPPPPLAVVRTAEVAIFCCRCCSCCRGSKARRTFVQFRGGLAPFPGKSAEPNKPRALSLFGTDGDSEEGSREGGTGDRRGGGGGGGDGGVGSVGGAREGGDGVPKGIPRATKG